MYLIKATKISQDQYEDYLAAWDDTTMVPFSASMRGADFEAQLALWTFEESEQVRTKGFVPAILYFLTDGTRLYGAIHLRLELNDFLLAHGGHIGYGVLPEYRRRGYADRMMTLIRPFLKAEGLSKVLLTCDADNAGSNKTIQKHGGVLDNQVTFEGKLTNRYWIEIHD